MQIFCRPPRVGYHSSQSAHGKGVAEAMVGYDYSSTVGMAIDSVTSPGSSQCEAISPQGTDKPTGGDASGYPDHFKFITTDGVFRSSAPDSGSTGILSSESIKSSM